MKHEYGGGKIFSVLGHSAGAEGPEFFQGPHPGARGGEGMAARLWLWAGCISV